MPIDRREAKSRRSDDLTDFTQCPRYHRYDLTEDQIVEIARKAIEIAKKDAATEVGEYVIDIGKSFATKLFFIIGALVLAFLTWASRHGIHF